MVHENRKSESESKCEREKKKRCVCVKERESARESEICNRRYVRGGEREGGREGGGEGKEICDRERKRET